MTPIERLQMLLEPQMHAVNDLIAMRMASEHAPRIPEVTAHLINAGGKRIRPLITLGAAQLCGYQGGYDVHLAATVEFIHTATLLHDDVVDESAQRRGRATANLLWDNKSSVLVGDYLFSRAFQLMTETGSIKVLEILANASATIAEGEVLQLTAATDLATTPEVYYQVIRGKTAALFAAAAEVSGWLSGASEEACVALRSYGDALGISFQLVDDVLDYGGEAGALGKNTGDDFRERKLTLPVIYAYAAGAPEERAFWERCIGQGQQHEGDLAQAQRLIARHGTLNQTRQEALASAAAARDALRGFAPSAVKDALIDLADFVVSRIS